MHYHASDAAAEALVAEIARAGGKAVALAADLADEAAVRDAAAARRRRRSARSGCWSTMPRSSRTIRSPPRRARAGTASRGQSAGSVCADPGFRGAAAADAGGAVVNLLDERVWNLTPYFVSYTVSKAGLWTLTRTMALALAPRIRVNGDRPRPDAAEPAPEPRAIRSSSAATMPLRRGTSPREIAAALRFILAAPAMTGQMIALDGGSISAGRNPAHAAGDRIAESDSVRRQRQMSQLTPQNSGPEIVSGAKLFTAVWPIC